MTLITCPNCNFALNDKFAFCPECGTNLTERIICKTCDYSNELNSKFCQECGASIGKESLKPKSSSTPFDISTIPEPNKNGITIEFPYTTAHSFEFAVLEARKLTSFVQFGTDKKAIYRVEVLESELFKLRPLLEQLKGWRKRIVYYNGEKVQWDSIFEYAHCYERKQASYKPEYYCFGYENEYEFNIWGCTRTRLPFTENSPLFKFGKWLNNTGDWEFDKERIKHELMKNIFGCRFCPAINTEHIKDILEALPSVINPLKNNNWKFVESYYADNNALTINSEYGMTKYLVGVCPNGKKFIDDISNKIKNRIPEFVRK